MIRQLSYLSIPDDSLSEAAIERLTSAADLSNRLAGVTGMLAIGGGVIFQVLEGPRDIVQALLLRIRRDTRHGSLQILTDEMLPSRDFAGFGMALRTLDEEAVEMIGAAAFVDESSIPEIVAAMSVPALPRIAQKATLRLVHVAA